MANLVEKPSDILPNKDRSPKWPTNIVGSISHTSSEAIAVVASPHHHSALGVDIENWIELDVAQEIYSTILNDGEIELARCSTMDFHRVLTLVFSAKESLYKALFPSVRKYFGFECASVVSVNLSTGECTLMLEKSLSAELHKGKSFVVRFWAQKHHVVSLLVI